MGIYLEVSDSLLSLIIEHVTADLSSLLHLHLTLSEIVAEVGTGDQAALSEFNSAINVVDEAIRTSTLQSRLVRLNFALGLSPVVDTANLVLIGEVIVTIRSDLMTGPPVKSLSSGRKLLLSSSRGSNLGSFLLGNISLGVGGSLESFLHLSLLVLSDERVLVPGMRLSREASMSSVMEGLLLSDSILVENVTGLRSGHMVSV